MHRAARFHNTALLVALLVGCAGAGTSEQHQVELSRAATLSFDQVRAQVQPYDLTGRTQHGLRLLDAWLVSHPEPEGYGLRAEARLDLWVYAQLAADIDAAGSNAVLRALAGQVLNDPLWTPDAARLEVLASALSASVAADAAAAGWDAADAELGQDIASFHGQLAAPATLFEKWRSGGARDERLRLLLLGLMTAAASEGADVGEPRLSSVAWLCDGEASDDVDELADRCGFWCAALPAEAALLPTEEHDIHELGGDDTPVDFDDGPFEPEVYADLTPETADGVWFPTPGDVGYELVQACGADYFGLPAAGGVVLLNPANYLDLVYLSFASELMAGLELDLLRGDPLVVLSSPLLAAYADRFLNGGLLQQLTPAAYEYDVRLELPGVRGLGHLSNGGSDSPRLLLVRSDGIRLSLRPHLRLDRRDGHYAVVYAEEQWGYHYPGLEVARFPRTNRLDEVHVDGDRIPLLRRGLIELERRLAEIRGDQQDDATASECGVRAGEELAAWVDASTYWETLRPILGTVVDCGYEHIGLYGLDAGADYPVQVPVSLSLRAPVEAHRLSVDNGRFSFTAYSDGEAVEALQPEQRDEAPLLTIHRHVAAGIDSGSIDPQWPLVVAVEHERVDWGILAQTLQAVAYRRDLASAATELDLMQADPVLVDGAQPVPLFTTGVFLSIE